MRSRTLLVVLALTLSAVAISAQTKKKTDATSSATASFPAAGVQEWKESWHKKYLDQHKSPSDLPAKQQKAKLEKKRAVEKEANRKKAALAVAARQAASPKTPTAPEKAVAGVIPTAASPVLHTKPDPAAVTKPDEIAHTRNGSAVSSTDGWKMALYLIPVLVIILLALRGLLYLQNKTGLLNGAAVNDGRRVRTLSKPRPEHGPTVWNALVGGLSGSASRKGSGAIQILESTPLGPATLHLIEVKGHTLLLAGTGMNVALLADVTEKNAVSAFEADLQAATDDLEALGVEHPAAPVSSLLSSLETDLRDTGEVVVSRTRRLRKLHGE